MTLPRAYEDDLVERAKTDPAAFGELYDHYVGQIHRFVYSRVRDQDHAEDITSQVFFKALRALGRYRPSGHPFSSWLYQISINAITDHYRGRRPETDLETAGGVADRATPVADHVADRDEASRIWAEIDLLPPAQRTALTLKLGEDMKLADIGVVMGRSEGAVKLLVHRGMTTLRARLAPAETQWAGRATPPPAAAPGRRR